MKCFCKAYESDAEAANELGVILTQHYQGNEEMKRASLKDSYQFILGDLNRAAELLALDKDYDPATDGALFTMLSISTNTPSTLCVRVSLFI